jgi:hypothetical protein
MKNKQYLLVGCLAAAVFALPAQAAHPRILGATVSGNTITITSPIKDASWNIGSTYTISWSSNTPISNVSILGESYNDSVNFINLGYIAKNIPNTGSYTWTIGSDMQAYDNALTQDSPFTPEELAKFSTKIIAGQFSILVTDPQGLIFGYADITLVRLGVTPPTVRLTANGTASEVEIDKGASVTLAWNAENALYCEGESYQSIKTSDGLVWGSLKNLPVSGSKTLDTTEAIYSLGPSITCYNSYGDSTNNSVYIYFKPASVTPPTPLSTVVVSAPKSGEAIKLGSNYTIKWSGGTVDQKIKIVLYGYNEKSKTNFFSYIVTDAANTGSYIWNTNADLTPNSISSSYSAFTKLVPGNYYILVYVGTEYANTGFFTVYSGDSAVKYPIGHLDGISNGKVRGWALDPDIPNNSVLVDLYFDGLMGSNAKKIESTANLLRDDVNKATGYFASYGFEIAIPEDYKDGKPHSVYAYALDLSDPSKHTLLAGSPFKFSILGKPTTAEDGTLFKDGSVIYVMENGMKRGFVTMDAFKGLGYNISRVRIADTSDIAEGPAISTANTRHPRGAAVVAGGTIYFMGQDYRYAYPSAEVFLSWSQKFENVVLANQFDLSIPEGPLVQLYLVTPEMRSRDARRISDIRQLQTAFELYYNDCGMYPASLTIQTNTGCPAGTTLGTYLQSLPVNPTPGGSTYAYTSLGSNTDYALTFSLEADVTNSSQVLYKSGLHTASSTGIR